MRRTSPPFNLGDTRGRKESAVRCPAPARGGSCARPQGVPDRAARIGKIPVRAPHVPAEGAPVPEVALRSWILRHRLRLRLVYGPGSPAADAPGEPGENGVPAPSAACGRLRRSKDGLELVPMPRRVGRDRRVG
jgi:hypothetical protein